MHDTASNMKKIIGAMAAKMAVWLVVKAKQITLHAVAHSVMYSTLLVLLTLGVLVVLEATACPVATELGSSEL